MLRAWVLDFFCNFSLVHVFLTRFVFEKRTRSEPVPPSLPPFHIFSGNIRRLPPQSAVDIPSVLFFNYS